MLLRRRDALRVVGSGAAIACVASTSGGCAYLHGAASGPIAAGNVRAIAPNSLDFVKSVPVLIGRDDGGVYAMTAICTHWGCDMHKDGAAVNGSVTCGCHGSRFDASGRVLEGPAEKPLDHFKVEVAANGEVTVFAGTIVDVTFRAKVPTGVV